MYNSETINKHFDLPITHIEKKYKITKEIIDDLELVESHNEDTSPMYHYLFNPKNNVSKITTKMWSKYYTDDKTFLEDSQKLYKNLKIKNPHDTSKFEKFLFDVKNTNDFLSKYHFVDIKYFESLNHNPYFLKCLSVYNLTSPVLALISPIVILILPFLILKMRKIPVTFVEYKQEIKKILGKHAIGAFINNFNKVGLDKKMYLAFSLCFYFFQMYNNCLICYRFYKNQKYIHDLITEAKSYLKNSINQMEDYLKQSAKLTSYSKFNSIINKNKSILQEYLNKIDNINEFNSKKNLYKNFNEIGIILRLFHRFRYDNELNNAIFFSLGFNGYSNNLFELQKLINNKTINYCKFTNNKTSLKKVFYPSLKDNKNVIKNNLNIKKNFIITGPNASGKTTLIKTIMLNIIFSQQLSIGFYKEAYITPFKYLHCYINIPDTSSRDSLFQAEARRCKDIIEVINKDPEEKHFCLFDELYSGTNPEEASASAFAFIDHLTKNNNVKFLLTTHFINICEKLDKNTKINNIHMVTNVEKNKLYYKYIIDKGISNVKGGLEVLKDLEYPDDLVDVANKFEECG